MVRKFILQWHLTENCNLKCLHCYQENHKPICQTKKNIINIFDQYKELLKKLNMNGHINITGGEPLCYPFLFDLLDLIKQEKNISFSILTNGTLINEEIVKKLKKYNPEYIQVSLEGSKKMNDYIRGNGTYKKIGKALDILRKYDIFTSISFTATKLNYKEFPYVVKFALKHKVNNVWSDRYIPLGGSVDKDLTMSFSDTQEYLEIMQKERLKLLDKKNVNTTISMYRALQFQKTMDYPYSCSAGDTLLTVMENGDLVPCRRMPIVVGNLYKDNMYDLYENNKILKDLRKKVIPKECSNCDDSKLCRGGLRCLTYALKKNYNLKDVGCGIE